jgi:hypothetical protein
MSQGLGLLLGSLFTPTWFLLKTVLSFYLPIDTIFRTGINTATVMEFMTRLEALGPQVLLGQMAPLLLMCQVISFAFLYICGNLGKRAARILTRPRQSEPA